MGIDLPKDATGREISPDVEFLYTASGEPVKPYSFTFRRYDGFCWEMHLVGAPNLVYDPKSFHLNKPDSLEQLAADIDRMMGDPGGYVCAYFNVCNKDCKDCRAGIEDPKYTTRTFACDVARRVHHLAGDAE